MPDEKNSDEEFVEKAKNYRGWDLASESYYIDDEKWLVQKDCKTPIKEGRIRELSNKINNAVKDLKDEKITPEEGLSIARTCNKEILEMTLIGFSYDEKVEKFGHRTLGEVSLVMQSLFLEIGGWEELIYFYKRRMIGSKLQLKQEEADQNG